MGPRSTIEPPDTANAPSSMIAKIAQSIAALRAVIVSGNREELRSVRNQQINVHGDDLNTK